VQPRVVIFDFNGTLIDDLHIAYGSVQKIFSVYHLSCPTIDQFREEISADFMEFYYGHGFPRTTTVEELNTIRKSFYETSGHNAKIRMDVPATLRWLFSAGLHTAIVSAERSATLYKYLVQGGLQKWFDCILPEAWGKGTKQKYLLSVAEIFEVEPSDMIYVDDTVDGLTAARNAGVIPVAFTNPTGYNSASRLLKVANLSIKEISEVGEIVKI